jgi:hypothetical protein
MILPMQPFPSNQWSASGAYVHNGESAYCQPYLFHFSNFQTLYQSPVSFFLSPASSSTFSACREPISELAASIPKIIWSRLLIEPQCHYRNHLRNPKYPCAQCLNPTILLVIFRLVVVTGAIIYRTGAGLYPDVIPV